MTEQLASLVPILTGDSVADDRLKHLWPEVKNKKQKPDILHKNINSAMVKCT